MCIAFLVKIIGIVIFAFGLGGVVKSGNFKKMLKSFSASFADIYIVGILYIVIGFCLRGAKMPLLMQIFGWALLIKGTIMLVLPEMVSKIMDKMADTAAIVKIYPWILLVAGIVLIYLGFFVCICTCR
jgi:hypothetical protein